jgi:hypothetical protein
MRIANVRSGLVGALLLAVCAAEAQPPGGDPIADLIEESSAPAVPNTPAEKSPATGTLERFLAGLANVSCPKGAASAKAGAVAIKVRSVPLQAFNPMRISVGQLSFVGGFHLASDDERFGGLSGIDVLDDGNLLAVSDKGGFVWIDVAGDGFTPVAARMSEMHDAKGRALRGKANGDAEGLAVVGGTALVSFEGNHRVLAFDIGECGAVARGAPIVTGRYGRPMADAFAAKKLKVDSNQGPEPLAVTPDWYMFTGIETKAGRGSSLSARPIEAPPEFDLEFAEGAPEFVGLDLLQNGEDIRAFSLHRSTQALSGAAIVVKETVFERYLDQAKLPARVVSGIDERSHWKFRETSSRTLAEMNVLLTIDNYESIAAARLPDGRVRLFILSDDNFSTSQRTLLMVFDVK